LRKYLHLCLFAVLLFALSLALFTRGNEFLFFYHPDESSKVQQIQTAEWNFNHPMLMLTTARCVALVSGNLENSQAVVVLGRWVSAAFMAAAVALLAATVWLTADAWAGALAGLLLLTNQQLFELAHYFKEDASLLFGLSVWFLALALFQRKPDWKRALLVGAGAALAVSGKYLGAFAPVVSPLLLWLMLPKENRTRFGPMLAFWAGGFILSFALVNLPLILGIAKFQASLHREVSLAVDSQRGSTRSVPHSVYLSAFRDNVVFLLWVFIGFFAHHCWKLRRTLPPLDGLLLLVPVGFLTVLSFVPKTNDRYFLPATALFLCVAARGFFVFRHFISPPAASLSEASGKRRVLLRYFGTLLLLACFTVQLLQLGVYYSAFVRDDRKELITWLNANLPDAVLAQDDRALMPTEKRPEFLPYQPKLTPRVIEKRFTPTDSVESLRAAGVTHVILSESNYGRYFLKSLQSHKKTTEQHAETRGFYEAIRKSAPPLWFSPRSKVTYLHPGLEVYALPNPH
jgi:hypothetical protein